MVGAQVKSTRYEDSDFEEEEKYLTKEVAGFWVKVQAFNQDNTKFW